jgi:hypothetical protein
MTEPNIGLIDILEELLERTQAGNQTWEIDPDQPTAYLTQVGNWKLRMASVDEDGVAPYRLSLLDQSGEDIESIQTTKSSGSTTTRTRITSRNNRLRDLYHGARRQVHGITDALQEIYKELTE